MSGSSGLAAVAEPSSLMLRLRAATAAEHEAMEQELRLTRADVSLGDYRRYLTRMWGIHAPIEQQLDALPALASVLPDVADRRRRRLLEQDLRWLGLDDAALAALPAAPCLPGLSEPGAALGALYVLEGSTLGGQYLCRHLDKTLGAAVVGATEYLGAYADVGAMWKRFRAALDAYGAAAPDAQPAIVDAAVATFRAIRGWLAEAERS